ncbi:MAG: methylated-DNA--[protein]-cysteine S-methyltransferase [Pseudobdellovibrio sp.]
MKYNYQTLNSPVGLLHAVSNSSKLVALVFDLTWADFLKKEKYELVEKSDDVIRQTAKELQEYFNGLRTGFDIPLELNGTEFQKQAWNSLIEIPFGKTISYAEQAVKIKNPKAVRAIGAANGKNKICIIVPCHRVVGKNGSLTGFAGGIQAKEMLLLLEKSR